VTGEAMAGSANGHAATAFGPENPFYAASTLPFQAPPFDRIKDSDYQPAIEAGMAEQIREVEAIAGDTAPPTFENTLVALEKTGQLLTRAMAAFHGVTSANTNPDLEQVQTIEAPKLAAHHDAIYLNAKLFARIRAVYDERAGLELDAESLRLVEYVYDNFVKAGAALPDAEKERLKELNLEAATLSNDFIVKLLAATKTGAFSTTDEAVLNGLSEAQLAAAAETAKDRGADGWVLPLQNTTQQPYLELLAERATRKAMFENSWNRAERGDTNDTRVTIARLAQVRAEKAKLLGFANYAAWKLQDQMAKNPETAKEFLDKLVDPAKANAAREAQEIQTLIDTQQGGFALAPWDWNFYAEQVRKQKYGLDEVELKPYFEVNKVLEDGVFYAASMLYGITFKERHDIPVYHPEVRVFEVLEEDGRPVSLFYCDLLKRDNKNGGAWMGEFVGQSKLLDALPVIYNVSNFAKPAPGEPTLISFDDVTTMFHEFGHALHGMFADTEYPSLSGTNVPRDFVELPSQFNEHWATYPEVFDHFARHYKTGEPMPAEMKAKVIEAAKFNEGYALTEVLAAAELDLQWHTLPAGKAVEDVGSFETEALKRTRVLIDSVPPRYRSSYFMHIWGHGYAAGYYAYLWSELLDNNAYQWFEENGGLTRENGDRFRHMVLSRGNTEDLQTMYERWLGRKPTIEPMLKARGLS
jgi:peptidyl-dipeptidase Dcp